MFPRPDSTPARSECEDLEKAIHHWRRDLPPELHLEVVENWSSDTVWLLVLRAMSYRLECVLYRKLRKLYDVGEKHRAPQKQQNSMLELSAILDRIVLQDLVSCCPLAV